MSALAGIYNFREVTPDLACAGQPSEGELASVAEAGYAVVVNLGLLGTQYALPDEAGRVRALGMDYVHLPVQWRGPTPADLHAFLRAMRALAGRRVFVHCAANKRATAFLAVHCVRALGWTPERARGLVRSVWEPDALWARLLAEAGGLRIEA